MTRTISNTDDVIDSHDVIERIEELEDARGAIADHLEGTIAETHTESHPTLDGLCKAYLSKPTETLNLDMLCDWLAEFMPDTDLQAAAADLAEWDAENAEELKALKSLADEAEGSPDWVHGEGLIRESYFEDHIRELVNDCYPIPKDFDSGAWPWRHMTMDWAAAAEEAKQDYTEVDFGGVTYLIRS